MKTDELRAAWTEYKATQACHIRNRIAEHYMPYVVHTASKLYQTLPVGTQIDLQDLISEGCFGLLDAIEAFDLERGYSFTTFCARRVHGAMVDGMRRFDWVPRLERQRQRANEDHAVTACGSLNDLMDLMHVHFAGPDERPGKRLEDLDTLRLLTRGLNQRERLIVISYYWLGESMKDVAWWIGVSESRVSQMHAQILVSIAERLTRSESPPEPPEAPEPTHTEEPDVDMPVEHTNTEDAMPDHSSTNMRDPSVCPPRPQSISELLSSFTLAGIEAEIAQHRREIDALTILRDAIAVRDGHAPPGKSAVAALPTNGAPQTTPPQAAPTVAVRPSSLPERLQVVSTYLQASGPKKAAVISADCGIPMGSIYSVLADPRFKKLEDGTFTLRA